LLLTVFIFRPTSIAQELRGQDRVNRLDKAQRRPSEKVLLQEGSVEANHSGNEK